MKISQQAMKRHHEAMSLINVGRELTLDEMEQVLAHFIPRVSGYREAAQEFFTPVDLANSLAYEVGHQNDGTIIVDICAGIGGLSFAVQQFNYSQELNIHAIEINPDFVEIGKNILPRVTWHCGDFRDLEIWKKIPKPHVAISNPPFGKIPEWTGKKWLSFSGTGALQVIEAGNRQARGGITAIVSQSYSLFHYSGRNQMKQVEPSGDLKRFLKIFPDAQFGISSIDTDEFRNQWKGAKPVVEIVHVKDDSAKRIVNEEDLVIIPELDMTF